MKKSKKFVLAGLVLLAAITMVLLPLSSCKNDSVPPEATSGTETKPVIHTVTFNTDGGSTVASQTVESGQKATRPDTDPTLEGSWFLGWYSDEGLAKKFDFNTPITTATTVYAKWSYKLHTKPTTLTNYTNSHAPEGEWTYVEFGDWPQTIKDASVKVDGTKSKQMGMFTYYLGSDGNHYVKAEEKAYKAGYKYSDDSDVNPKDESSSPSTRWFKVEPIVWRVLTEDYKAPDGNSTGNALLLAEKILTGGIPYYVSRDMRSITKEKETGTETETVPVYANNWQYSTIRAWLNGRYESDDSQANEYAGKGFLQTAFTESAQSLIADTSVDNSAASTFRTGENTQENPYACDKTKDKIFLLSQQEATTLNSGFGAHIEEDSTRIRVTTDYAKATGAYQASIDGYGDGYGGLWWLRSPHYGSEYGVCGIGYAGSAYNSNSLIVNITAGGVVPALSISLTEN